MTIFLDYNMEASNIPAPSLQNLLLIFEGQVNTFKWSYVVIYMDWMKWDLMSWMTSNYDVEIRALSVEDKAKRKVSYCKFGRHWKVIHEIIIVHF
jgi:hypothetical protein